MIGASLFIDVLGRVAGKRTYDYHLVVAVPFWDPFEARLEEYGEIRADHEGGDRGLDVFEEEAVIGI